MFSGPTDPTDFKKPFEKRQKTPWFAPKGLSGVIDGWKSDAGFSRCFALDEILPSKEATYAPIPETLHPSIRKALADRGITQLYSHQAEAFALASAGTHTVVATPTASGKSLCFHLPVLDRLAKEPGARALYLYPTKALSRDQEASFGALMRDAGLSHGAITYDGDTPGDARRVARERSNVILTNPDMLHAGILPHHANWSRLFASLRYVVLDELHMYRGVFGSHLANVLRRLHRIARFHGSNPTFIFASATIGNPQEHAARMLGSDVALVRESGAPAGPRRVMVYDPPVVNPELGIRASYIKSAVRITADLLRAEVPTIVFGQSRNNVEVMLKYLRDTLARDKIDPAVVHAYRGGYLPETRRRIEEQLRTGALRCVVATNALELGIDIGCLDAVVCAGYPGSVAGLWQRFGRAGRRKDGSLAVLVASSAPVDQYVARDPAWLTGTKAEEARIDPDNIEILIQHTKCAAFELPFEDGESFGDVPADVVHDALGYLAKNDIVHAAPSKSGKTVYHWTSDAYPANEISLRSITQDNFVIIELPEDRNIAEMDFRGTHTMLHEQAIYQHEGEQYQVERLDYENHKAYVRKVAPDYYTDAMTYTKVTVIDEDDAAFLRLSPDSFGGVAIGLGEVNVTEKVVGFKKIKFHTHENTGHGDVDLPELSMNTSGVWITVPEETVVALAHSEGVARADVIDAIRGIGNALHVIAAVGLMVDPRDIGHTIGDRSDGGMPAKDGAPLFDPTLFLYDQIPGGIGLAPRLFEERETLLRRARASIETCSCGDGCPACVGVAIGADVGALVQDASTAVTPGVPRKRLARAVFEAIGVLAVH